MTVTMADIARKAGCGIATVGRVIHGNGYVSGKVRERIEKAIAELGYVPDQSARALKAQRSGIIGCLVLQSDNGLYYRINDEIIQAAEARGLTCIPLEAQKRGGESALLQTMLGMHADGIVLISEPNVTDEHFALLRRFKTPVAAIERGYSEQGVDSLLVRDREAVQDAVGRMIRAGHRRVALIAREPDMDVERRRLQGYLDALEAAGIEADDALIRLCGDYTVSFGREAMEALLALPEPPTAVMATADTLAAGVLQAAYAAGLRIPDDLSVCGYDNVLSQALSPAIDSVGLSLKGLGEKVLNLLEKRRKTPDAPPEILDIETDYISRGTVTAPKA